MFEIILFIEISLYDKLHLRFKYNTTYKLIYFYY